MRFTVNDQVVLNQKPDGPLKPYISQFAEYVGNQGSQVPACRMILEGNNRLHRAAAPWEIRT